jgi:hypothetical protein
MHDWIASTRDNVAQIKHHKNDYPTAQNMETSEHKIHSTLHQRTGTRKHDTVRLVALTLGTFGPKAHFLPRKRICNARRTVMTKIHSTHSDSDRRWWHNIWKIPQIACNLQQKPYELHRWQENWTVIISTICLKHISVNIPILTQRLPDYTISQQRYSIQVHKTHFIKLHNAL